MGEKTSMRVLVLLLCFAAVALGDDEKVITAGLESDSDTEPEELSEDKKPWYHHTWYYQNMPDKYNVYKKYDECMKFADDMYACWELATEVPESLKPEYPSNWVPHPLQPEPRLAAVAPHPQALI